MTTRQYQPYVTFSTTTVVTPTTKDKDLPLSRRFMERAREKRDAGQDYYYWVKAARILWRIEHNLPVGHYRRRKRTSRPTGKGATR